MSRGRVKHCLSAARQANRSGRNDAAIKKAEGLAQIHGIKAIAYKVDSKLDYVSVLSTRAANLGF